MKRLLLLRHAKSSWAEPDRDDFDRPLDERGERGALVMGQFLRQRDLRPDLVVTSPAHRAIETVALVESRIGDVPIEETRSLYLAEPDAVLTVVRALDAGTGTVLLVGHNPGFETFAARLLDDPASESARLMARKFPTAGLASFTLPIGEWSEVRYGLGRLDGFQYPRLLV